MKRKADADGMTVARVRVQVARLLWLLCVVAALFLAVGVFSRKNGIKEYTGENAATKNALFNWGLGAVAWLVIGRILERIVRP